MDADERTGGDSCCLGMPDGLPCCKDVEHGTGGVEDMARVFGRTHLEVVASDETVGHGNNPPEKTLIERALAVQVGGDMLDDLMERQKRFLGRLRRSDPERWGTMSEELREQVLMLFAEAAELLEHTPWKKHRRDYGRTLTPSEREAVLEEAVDILHFVFNVFIILGADAAWVYRLYVAKNTINHERQDAGY